MIKNKNNIQRNLFHFEVCNCVDEFDEFDQFDNFNFIKIYNK